MVASIFHILVHAATKALLFVSAIGLTDVSGGSRHFAELTGSGYRNKVAGVGFTVGSLSMVGIPLFSGFVSKLLFAEAAVIAPDWRMFPTLIVLAISTVLNAIYFLKTVLRIYAPTAEEWEKENGFYRISCSKQRLYTAAILLFIGLNLILGLTSQPILELIKDGLHHFA